MRALLLVLLAAAYSLNTSAAEPTGATPGGISISPVRVDLTAGRRAEALTVTNTGAYRRTVEAAVFRWTQVDGQDRYEPTRELLANPPLFFIEPGATQTVRIGRPASAPVPKTSEAAYRVYFQETQSAQPQEGSGLKFALRIGVPVFVLPDTKVQPVLTWNLNRDADGGLRLRVSNTGAMHARLADLRLKDGVGGEWPLDGFRYVLPGQWQEWLLPAAQAPERLPSRLSVLSESGRAEHELGAVSP